MGKNMGKDSTMTPVVKITHDELIKIGRDWPIHSRYASCSVVLTELCANTKYGEQPDIIGFGKNKSILIECKTSLSDFFADQKKVFRYYEGFGIGRHRWYLAPVGVIPVDKVPEKWGLLEVKPDGKIKVLKFPILQDRDYQSEINMLISTMRRLNILPDDHVSIKKYTPDLWGTSKKKATFYIEEVPHDTQRS
jgi:hypothetical protein